MKNKDNIYNKLNIEIISVDELKEYENNVKLHPKEQIEQIKKSISNFNMIDPIGIDENNVIIEGHGRLEACKELGYKEVPCIRLTHLNEEQKNAYRLIHNQLTMNSGFDLQGLKDELDKITLDMSEFSFDLTEIQNEISKLNDKEKEIIEDDVSDVKETSVKRGDIYILGNHRLMCGDSTSSDDVEKLMNGSKANLVFTDPPYGMKKEKEGVLNDNLNYDDLLEFNKKWIPLSFEHTKDNGSWYCWGIDEPLMDIYSNILKPMIKNKEIAFRNLITWDKGNGQGQLAEDFRMYPIADEKCLFVMIGGDSVQGFCVNQEDYSENMDKVRLYLETEIKKLKQSDKVIANALGYKDGRTVNHWWSKSQFALPTRENYEALREYGKSILKDNDFLKKDYDELKKDFYAGRSYFDNIHDNMNNVWHFDRAGKDERVGHATPKPIALCSRAIKTSSRENEIVLDLFGGSGSTLIACEQLNRKCYMMELDEYYCQVIINRWEKLTGNKAKKVEV